MATTMVKDTTNSKWKLTETGSTTQTYSKTIKCGGSYMEYDVDVAVTARAGAVNTPATTITAQPTITVGSDGLITATNSKTQSVTPNVSTAGWISSGTAGTITVNGSKTSQLTTKAATTYTPGTTDQTVNVSGTTTGIYLTGVQKILGDANLVAGNIKYGVSIFGVTGTLKSTATDDPNVANAAVGQILEGYEAFDKDGGTLTGAMADYTGVDLTSSATTGKTMTLTLNGAGTLYTIKMYAGSTGYAVQDSTFITDTVAASSISSNSVTPGASAQTVTVTAGYAANNRTITIAAAPSGSVTISNTNIEAAASIGSYVENSGYPINISGSATISATVSEGWVDSVEDATATIVDNTKTYIAQSTLSANSVTPNVDGTNKTVTVGAGYYPSSRTITVSGVNAGAITLAASVSSNIAATDSNGSNYSIGQSAQPSGTNYVKLTPKATATASAPTANFTAGYISSKPADATLSNQAGTAIYLNIYDGDIE